MKGKRVLDLIYDFAMKFNKGDVESAEHYFKLLSKSNNMRLLVDCGMQKDKFDTCADFLDDLMASQ